jgi:hypothetical protein
LPAGGEGGRSVAPNKERYARSTVEWQSNRKF